MDSAKSDQETTEPDDDHQATSPKKHPDKGESEADLREKLKTIIETGDDVVAVKQLLDGHPDLDLEASFHYHFAHGGDEEGVTFLMLAGGLDRAGVVELLLQKGANIFAESRVFEDNVLTYAARENVSMRTFEKLLEQGGIRLVKMQNTWGWTALFYAVRAGHLEKIKLLLSKPESSQEYEVSQILEQEDADGWTLLHYAVGGGKNDAVEFLLEKGANLYAKENDGDTVLHIAVEYGRRATVQALLRKLDDHVDQAGKSQFQEGTKQEALSKRRNFVSESDVWGRSALQMAALIGNTSILLDILESAVFFPKHPTQDEPYFSDRDEVDKVSALLLKAELSQLDCQIKTANDDEDITQTSDQESDTMTSRIGAIIYWAILNRQKAIIDKYLAGSPSLPPLNRDGMSWAAVAALGADIPITETILQIEYGKTDLDDDKAIELLRLGIQNQNLFFIQVLLHWLGAQPMADQHHNNKPKICDTNDDGIPMIPPSKVLKIFLDTKDEKDDLISLSARGSTPKYRDIESFLWKVLYQSAGKEGGNFVRLGKKDRDRILELAARYEIPGDEGYLVRYLDLLASTQSNLDVLQRAVSLNNAVVVWWLLSNGVYPSESDVTYAKEKARLGTKNDQLDGQIILDILKDPPPIRQTRAPADDHHSPSFEHSDSDSALPQGTVLDFPRNQDQERNHVLFQIKHCSVNEIIYERGPQTIMKNCKYRKISTLKQALKHDSLAEAQRDKSKTERRFESKMGLEQGITKEQTSNSEVDVRWVHIPVTDLRYMKELVVRMSKDKNFTNKDHRPLASFIDKNQAKMSAGGHKTYMKPQYVAQSKSESDQKTEETNMQHVSALYMPFLGWSSWPRKPDLQPVQSQNDLANKEQPYMTLDQYYYASIDATTQRDGDQVVGRFTQGTEKQRSVNTQQRNKHPSTILIVKQLWLYTLDEKTTITFTTRESADVAKSFFQRVLANLMSQKNGSSWSVAGVREIILSTAIGTFNMPEISKQDNSKSKEDNPKTKEDNPESKEGNPKTKEDNPKKSQLAIFRESIQNVREKEAGLYSSFCEKLEDDRKQEDSSQQIHQSKGVKLKRFFQSLLLFMGLKLEASNHDKSTTGISSQKKPDGEATSVSRKEYDNILEETKQLREIKDISDELNILQSLAENQKDVCEQLWGKDYDSHAAFAYDTPAEIKDEIEEMIKDAEFVQKSLDMLLDLKQKQANINEAKNSRKQSEETAKQGVAIMVFTLVTIAFLPASFLTSLFALNVSDFPHVGETVSYSGHWIFPIIFGVSVGVSGIIALIAFQMTKWSERWKAAKSKLENDIEAGKKELQAGHTSMDAHRASK